MRSFQWPPANKLMSVTQSNRRDNPEKGLCLFCSNPANSKEDLFPRWILASVITRELLSRRIGDAETQLTEDQEVRIPCVCIPCNNGWMSRLETKCKPIIGNLLEDISIPLDPDYQKFLAVWALKGAMILDAEGSKPRFFRKDECENLKKSRTIPNGTGIWIGRFTGRTLSVINGGFSLATEQDVLLARCDVFSVVVGHLAMQVLSVHEEPDPTNKTIQIAPVDGKWDELLIQIWPKSQKKVTWPPTLSFSHYGTHPYGSLVYRWTRPRGHSIRSRSR
jgi:hypothetical protein